MDWPPVENASGGQKEAANTHRAHPSTRGRSVADPSDQGALTRHKVTPAQHNDLLPKHQDLSFQRRP
jgi:hypothetical protein